MDKTTDIYDNGAFIILASRPAMGKTALALDIARHLAGRSDKNILIFSLEMSKKQILDRLQKAEDTHYPNILIEDNPLQSVEEIEALCRKTENLGGVIIDYMQLIVCASPSGKQKSRQTEVSDIASALKSLASALCVPVICTSQISRSCEYRSDKRPTLQDLYYVGEDADLVLFLYRDRYYCPQTPVGDMAECIVAKNRYGDAGTIKLLWDPKRLTFSRWDE